MNYSCEGSGFVAEIKQTMCFTLPKSTLDGNCFALPDLLKQNCDIAYFEVMPPLTKQYTMKIDWWDFIHSTCTDT